MAVRLLKSIFTGVASLNFGRSGPEELGFDGIHYDTAPPEKN